MANLYPFIRNSLNYPFSKLVFSDVSSWDQYKLFAFNIVLGRILIFLVKYESLQQYLMKQQIN